MNDEKKAAEKKITAVSERPEVTAAREKLQTAQQAYEDLIRQSKKPVRDKAKAAELADAMKSALEAKRAARSSLNQVIFGK